jgi:transcriptional regulator with XRE-family HTH domain
MTTRWKRFYEKQMEDAKQRELVESELENLQLAVQIAKLRAAENLSQTKLAARAEMNAPKISAMENEPRKLTIGTLIRVAHALASRVEIKLVQRSRTKRQRRSKQRRKVKTRILKTEGCGTRPYREVQSRKFKVQSKTDQAPHANRKQPSTAATGSG